MASWSAEDPESYIQSYEYAIGTTVGGTDIAGWADVSLALGMHHSGLALANGSLCYVSVRATNCAGLQATATSAPIRAVETPGTIAAALAFADSTWLALTGKLVTGVVAPYAWIEEPERYAAVRLETSLPVAEGQKVTTVGQMATPVYTRQIVPERVELESAGHLVMPIGMQTVAVGGSARNSHARGVDGGIGPNNVGTLVTIWGTVTSAGTGFFYVDDGCGLLDGTGNRGVRVISEELTNPGVGQFVSVTGLVNASRLLPLGQSIRVLIPRRQTDILPLGTGGPAAGLSAPVPANGGDIDEAAR